MVHRVEGTFGGRVHVCGRMCYHRTFVAWTWLGAGLRPIARLGQTQTRQDKSMVPSQELSDIDRQIVYRVRERWKENKTPLLLSELGNMEKGSIGRHAKEKAQNLGSYLRNYLAEFVRVVGHPDKASVIGVVPAEAEDFSIDAFDRLATSAGSLSSPGTPRYHAAFWAAFRKPLDIPKRRYLSLEPPTHFRDMELEETPDGFIEIEPRYIADADMETIEIVKHIEEWIELNKLDESQFLWAHKKKDSTLPPNSLLDRFLFALDPEDLKRVSMPLDVIKKLRREAI